AARDRDRPAPLVEVGAVRVPCRDLDGVAAGGEAGRERDGDQRLVLRPGRAAVRVDVVRRLPARGARRDREVLAGREHGGRCERAARLDRRIVHRDDLELRVGGDRRVGEQRLALLPGPGPGGAGRGRRAAGQVVGELRQRDVLVERDRRADGCCGVAEELAEARVHAVRVALVPRVDRRLQVVDELLAEGRLRGLRRPDRLRAGEERGVRPAGVVARGREEVAVVVLPARSVAIAVRVVVPTPKLEAGAETLGHVAPAATPESASVAEHVIVTVSSSPYVCAPENVITGGVSSMLTVGSVAVALLPARSVAV